MSGWRDAFDYETIAEARKIPVGIINQNDYEIVTRVDGEFEVTALMFYGTPYLLNCDCEQFGSCVHEAAVYLYLEKYLDFINININSNEIVDSLATANVDKLKSFLFDKMMHSKALKRDYLQFFGKGIDKKYYNLKLDGILEKGLKMEFTLEDDYDLDILKEPISEFLHGDLINILKIGEYDFASVLLCRIGDILMLDSSLNYESWEDLVEVFFEFSTPLKVSLHVVGSNHDKLIKIEEYIDKILY